MRSSSSVSRNCSRWVWIRNRAREPWLLEFIIIQIKRWRDLNEVLDSQQMSKRKQCRWWRNVNGILVRIVERCWENIQLDSLRTSSSWDCRRADWLDAQVFVLCRHIIWYGISRKRSQAALLHSSNSRVCRARYSRATFKFWLKKVSLEEQSMRTIY